jgi:hypothetical protein
MILSERKFQDIQPLFSSHLLISVNKKIMVKLNINHKRWHLPEEIKATISNVKRKLEYTNKRTTVKLTPMYK